MQVKRNISCEHRFPLHFIENKKSLTRPYHPYDFTYTKTAHAQAAHYYTAFNVLRVAAFQLPH